MHADVVTRFLEQAATRPHSVAISSSDGDMTYAALERRVRAFAARFAKRREPKVLIALPPSANLYAAILASGMAGGFHTPINLATPWEKIAKVAAALEPDFIVGNAEFFQEAAAVVPNAELVDPVHLDQNDLFEDVASFHRLAYVFFTSGSTGAPKGVMVPRSALSHYVAWLETLGIGPGDRVSQQPNVAFDISMTDIFGALCFGATLYPLDSEGARLMPARFIAQKGITVWNSTPSAISLMMQARQLRNENVRSVRLFNFCGEPLLKEHLDAIFAASPSVLVQNTYGPTEATISMTALSLRAEGYRDFCRASVALGPPIPGMDIVLNGGQTIDEGELVIVGPQLADGYWKDPVRTATAFRPVSEADPRRGYFTGDWVERRDGQLYFKERIDFQVKVRGHRIEMDEVAAAIRDCGYPVVVVFKRGEVLASVVECPCEGHIFSSDRLRAALAAKIEPYAIPERIIMIDRVPRNENDKLDRRAAAQLLETKILEAS